MGNRSLILIFAILLVNFAFAFTDTDTDGVTTKIQNAEQSFQRDKRQEDLDVGSTDDSGSSQVSTESKSLEDESDDDPEGNNDKLKEEVPLFESDDSLRNLQDDSNKTAEIAAIMLSPESAREHPVHPPKRHVPLLMHGVASTPSKFPATSMWAATALEKLEEYSCKAEAIAFGHVKPTGIMSHEIFCEIRKLWHYLLIAGKNLNAHFKSELESENEEHKEQHVIRDLLSAGTLHAVIDKVPVLYNMVKENPESLVVLFNIANDSVPMVHIQETVARLKAALQKFLQHVKGIFAHSRPNHQTQGSVLSSLQQHIQAAQEKLLRGHLAKDIANHMNSTKTLADSLANHLSQDSFSQYVNWLQQLVDMVHGVYQGYHASGFPQSIAAGMQSISPVSVDSIASSLSNIASLHGNLPGAIASASSSSILSGHLPNGGTLPNLLPPFSLPHLTPDTETPESSSVPGAIASSSSSSSVFSGHLPQGVTLPNLLPPLFPPRLIPNTETPGSSSVPGAIATSSSSSSVFSGHLPKGVTLPNLLPPLSPPRLIPNTETPGSSSVPGAIATSSSSSSVFSGHLPKGVTLPNLLPPLSPPRLIPDTETAGSATSQTFTPLTSPHSSTGLLPKLPPILVHGVPINTEASSTDEDNTSILGSPNFTPSTSTHGSSESQPNHPTAHIPSFTGNSEPSTTNEDSESGVGSQTLTPSMFPHGFSGLLPPLHPVNIPNDSGNSESSTSNDNSGTVIGSQTVTPSRFPHGFSGLLPPLHPVNIPNDSGNSESSTSNDNSGTVIGSQTVTPSRFPHGYSGLLPPLHPVNIPNLSGNSELSAAQSSPNPSNFAHNIPAPGLSFNFPMFTNNPSVPISQSTSVTTEDIQPPLLPNSPHTGTTSQSASSSSTSPVNNNILTRPFVNTEFSGPPAPLFPSETNSQSSWQTNPESTLSIPSLTSGNKFSPELPPIGQFNNNGPPLPSLSLVELGSNSPSSSQTSSFPGSPSDATPDSSPSALTAPLHEGLVQSFEVPQSAPWSPQSLPESLEESVDSSDADSESPIETLHSSDLSPPEKLTNDESDSSNVFPNQENSVSDSNGVKFTPPRTHILERLSSVSGPATLKPDTSDTSDTSDSFVSSPRLVDLCDWTNTVRPRITLEFPRRKITSALGKAGLLPGDVITVSLRNGRELFGRVVDSVSPISFNACKPRGLLSIVRRGGRIWHLRQQDFNDKECEGKLESLFNNRRNS